MENKNLDILENLDLNLKNEEKNNLNKLKNKDIDDIISSNYTPKEVSDDDILNLSLEHVELIENNESKDFENSIDDIIIEFDENIVTEKKEKKNSIISGIIYLFKYICTSTLIFGILLVSTNYNAYINIGKSYIYKNEKKIESKGIINSVEASNIKEKFKNEIDEIKKEEEKNQKELISEYSLKKLISDSNKNNINVDIEITPYDNRIVIPKIGKNIPLLDIKNRKIEGGEDELNDIFMKDLEDGVIRYPGSAKPGNKGNTFIFGHSSNFPWIKGDYNEVFSLLDNVEFDDEIYVYYGQKKYTYKIREKNVIKPGDISILKRNKNKKKKEITLMTCWPVGTTLNRLIVTGELVE